MIVKVQVPLMTSEPEPLAMVYNEKRDVNAMVPITKEIKKAMKGSFKNFFHAEVRGKDIVLGKKAPWQEW